jgi:hypothetical protein
MTAPLTTYSHPRETAARWLGNRDQIAFCRLSEGRIRAVRTLAYLDHFGDGIEGYIGGVEWWHLITPPIMTSAKMARQMGADLPTKCPPTVWRLVLSPTLHDVQAHQVRKVWATDDTQFVMRAPGELEPWDVDNAVRAADQVLLAQMLAADDPVMREVAETVVTVRPDLRVVRDLDPAETRTREIPMPPAEGAGHPMGGTSAGRGTPEAHKAWTFESERESNQE